MKKIIFIVITLLVAFFVYVNVNAEEIVIPDAAIRVRIIANSNSIYDQKMKYRVKEYIEGIIYPRIVDSNSVEEARDIINNSIEDINDGIKNLFNNYNYDMDYDINFGYNYFPNKKYKGISYRDGLYESLVVTIGKGDGDNWWCVLFPPLCLLEGDNKDDVEYRFFVKDIINKIFE